MIALARSGIERSPKLLISVAVFAVALAILYRWKSKLAMPVALALGAATGLAALT